jgi:hypothetical protein
MAVLTPIIVLISNIGSSGGEQKLFTTFVTILIITITGATLISFGIIFIFKTWLKSNKWFLTLTIIFSVIMTLFLWLYFFATPYSYVEKFRKIGGDEFEIKTEYYDNENKIIRSVRFWKNGKRDSTWKVLSEDGKIISEKIYRDGLLIKK